MADYVISGLVKRRAELAGEADALRARMARIGTDIGHLDAVIRQFDPDYNLVGIRPKRPRGADVAGRGERSRFILGVLRNAPEPVTVATIVQRIIAEGGGDAADGPHARMMAKRVAMSLRHQERQGTVRSVQEPGRSARWTVAS